MGSNCILGLTAPQEKTKHSRTHKHIHTRDRRVGGWMGGWVLSWSLWPMIKGVPPLVVVTMTAADWGGGQGGEELTQTDTRPGRPVHRDGL